MTISLTPILINEDPSKDIYNNDFCRSVFESYPSYYYRVGYNIPWIGYFVIRDGLVVGVGGFISEPIDNRVEIAYGTAKEFEGQGIASFTAGQLIAIAKTKSEMVIVTAKTSPEPNASTRILTKLGFEFTGVVQDDGIGDAWEWTLQSSRNFE